MTALATMVTLNRYARPRPSVMHAMVHFAPGAPWASLEDDSGLPLRIGDAVAIAEPRRRWPNGSLRSAAATWFQRAVAPGVSVLPVTQVAPGDVVDLPMPEVDAIMSKSMLMAMAQIRFTVGGDPVAWSGWQTLTDNALRFVSVGYGIAGGLWHELWLEGWHRTHVMRWAWRRGWHDRTATLERFVDAASLHIEGVQVGIRHARQRIWHAGDNSTTHIAFDRGRDWNDAQSQVVRGVFLFGDVNDPAVAEWLPELEHPVRVMQLSPLETGAFGMVGRVRSAVEDSEAWGLIENMLAKRPLGDPWQAGIWQATTPFQSGDRRGFGPVGPAAALFAAAPNALELMEFSADQEACRPTWFRDGKGRPLLAKDALAVHVWSERPFKTGDLLGKPAMLNIGTNIEKGQTPGAQSELGECWFATDRQHDEDVALVTHLLLTDDHVSKAMASERVERLLGALRVDSGNPTIDGTDSGRGARALGMLCRYSEVFPEREDVRDCIRERVKLYAEFRDQTPVKPQQVYAPTTQVGGLPTLQHWRPWEDAIVSYVMLFAWHATDQLDALTMASVLGLNIVRHGFRQEPDGSWQCGVALAWNDGQPLTAEQQADPLMARWGDGTDYRVWSYAAAAVAWNATLSQPLPQEEGALDALAKDLARCKQIMDWLAKDVPEEIAARLERLEWLAIELLPVPEWLAGRLAA